jgi:hypothetical protein
MAAKRTTSVKRSKSKSVKAFDKGSTFIGRHRNKILATAGIVALAAATLVLPKAYNKGVHVYRDLVSKYNLVYNELVRILRNKIIDFQDALSEAKQYQDTTTLNRERQKATELAQSIEKISQEKLLAKQQLELEQKKIEYSKKIEESNDLEAQRIAIARAKYQEEEMLRIQAKNKREQEIIYARERQLKEQEIKRVYDTEELRITKSRINPEKPTKRESRTKLWFDIFNLDECSTKLPQLENELKNRVNSVINYMSKIEKCKERTVLSIIDSNNNVIMCDEISIMREDYLKGNNTLKSLINTCKLRNQRNQNRDYFKNINNAKAKVDSGFI